MAAGTGPGITYSVPGEITVGKEMQRGFINDNVLHSPEHGDIHYSSYIPETTVRSRMLCLLRFRDGKVCTFRVLVPIWSKISV